MIDRSSTTKIGFRSRPSCFSPSDSDGSVIDKQSLPKAPKDGLQWVQFRNALVLAAGLWHGRVRRTRFGFSILFPLVLTRSMRSVC